MDTPWKKINYFVFECFKEQTIRQAYCWELLPVGLDIIVHLFAIHINFQEYFSQTINSLNVLNMCWTDRKKSNPFWWN